MPRKSVTEASFRSAVLAHLRGRGVWVVVPATRFAQSGVADILGCYNGRFVAIELKRPKGTYGVTPAQSAFLARVHAAGGVSGVARSLEEVDAILAECL
jgi:hypothetical protein